MTVAPVPAEQKAVTELYESAEQRFTLSWSEGQVFPTNCSPREAAQLIVTFFDAFNRGDQAVLANLFFESEIPGIEPSQWYSDGKFVTYSLPGLIPYFAERQAHHDHMQLATLLVKPHWYQDSVDVLYSLLRRADDLVKVSGTVKARGQGKGNINCRKQRIRVWSMVPPS